MTLTSLFVPLLVTHVDLPLRICVTHWIIYRTFVPDRPIGVKNVRVGKRDMPEYVRFVRRMLEVDKVQLITDPKGVASFFVVGKPGKSRLRPIWSGDVISSETKRPPMPRRLGNPASFVDIVVAKDEPLLLQARCGLFL